MPRADNKMFRVIVAGGIALTATAPGLVVGCGGATATTAHDGGESDAFPIEGRPSGYDAFPQETAQPIADGFPQEGPDVGIAEAGADAFPQEGPPPPPIDAHADGEGGLPDGFPMETASP